MRLTELLKNVRYEIIQGGDVEIKGICYDSRKTDNGFLFVCIKGFETDGHKYAQGAIERGAAAIVCEDIVSASEGVTVVKVENTRIALGEISSAFYGYPADKIRLVGVTGTNGKTTTTYLMDSIFRENGEKSGVIGTIENKICDRVIPTNKTTPESLELAELFSEMAESGVTSAAMEVSSHSLDMHRADFCKFEAGIFTNLSQDHLDHHITMENYLKSKARLFSMCRYGAVNGDAPESKYIIENGNCEFMTFGLNESNDLHASDIKLSSEGVAFTANIYGEPTEIKLSIPGKFSVYNALGAIAASMCLKIPRETIVKGLAENKGVRGRAQTVKNEKGINIIVDYSHTPDSLKNILETIKEFAQKKIITVFGCGGDRDKEKRPMMGEVAGKFSDLAIITSDNPRSENPDSILDEIEPGVAKTGCEYVKLADRREAINHAVRIAGEGDVVLIAGKGHEDYQVFADRTVHFDDAEEATEALRRLGEL